VGLFIARKTAFANRSALWGHGLTTAAKRELLGVTSEKAIYRQRMHRARAEAGKQVKKG